MPETAYIYGLLDPRTTELRYVGKTVSPKARRVAHKSDLYNARKVAWTRELTSLGLEPKFIIFDEVPFSEWQQRERETIVRYRNLGCNLLNVRGYGVQHSVIVTRSEFREKIIEEAGLRGHTQSEALNEIIKLGLPRYLKKFKPKYARVSDSEKEAKAA